MRNEVEGKHYDLKCKISSIEVIEDVINRPGITPSQAFCIANAIKYIIRLGVKTDKIIEDLSKAENYLHRAIHGTWIEAPSENKCE